MRRLEPGEGDARRDAAHRPAVERAVALMRGHLHESLALEDLASAACLSPYHFCRVFRQVTGSPPGEFLAALRFDAAKQLLLTTSLSVVEVCQEVGYSSLGSFTTRFTRFVGLPPANLRRLSAELSPAQVQGYGRRAAPSAGVFIEGRVGVAEGQAGPICVGLFERPIPQGYPLACTLLPGPGPYRVGPVPAGRYYALAAALPFSDDPLAYLLPGSGLLVAAAPAPLVVSGGRWSGQADLLLRPPRPIDPPVVVALPLLQARYSLGRGF